MYKKYFVVAIYGTKCIFYQNNYAILMSLGNKFKMEICSLY